jgi:shikimate dehydrogenase
MNAFVAGHPIKHSKSPLIHGTWLKRHQLQGSYQALDVPPESFDGFIAALKSGECGYVGGNITIPHKERALALADKADETAGHIGAANTLWLEDGILHATNTDAHGFAANLDEHHAGWAELETAVVYGAGGASRAVIVALIERGFKTVHVLNRTIEKAKVLADRFGPRVEAHPMETLPDVLNGAGLFVNTTSLGLGGDTVPVIDFSPMRPGALVTDIVYVPLMTGFLRQAQAQGLSTVDGLGMLLHQAVPGFEKWFGLRPTADADLRMIVETAMGVR